MLVQCTGTKKVYEYPYDQKKIIALKSRGYKCIKYKGNTAVYTMGKSFILVHDSKTRVYIFTRKRQFDRELELTLDKYSKFL